MNLIKKAIGGNLVEGDGLPESVFIDIILQRYGWTLSEFHYEFDKHPEYFGSLMAIMAEEGKKTRAARKKSEAANRKHEMDERRKRLGVI